MADVFTDTPQDVQTDTQPVDTYVPEAAEGSQDFTDSLDGMEELDGTLDQSEILIPTEEPEEYVEEPTELGILSLIHEETQKSNQLSTTNGEYLYRIDFNLSVLSDYLMQDLTQEETETLLSSGEETAVLTVEEVVEEDTSVEETDPYIEKLETLIELQQITNDNLVLAYNNLNKSVIVLTLVVSFIAGAVVLSNLFSKIRV